LTSQQKRSDISWEAANEKAIIEAQKERQCWNDGRERPEQQPRAAPEAWDAVHQELQKVEPELKRLQAQFKSIKYETLALKDQIDFRTDCLADIKANPEQHKRHKR